MIILLIDYCKITIGTFYLNCIGEWVVCVPTVFYESKIVEHIFCTTKKTKEKKNFIVIQHFYFIAYIQGNQE